MKILMLTPYLPYPTSSGGQIRSYNLIKNLAKTNEITLFSLIKREEERKYVGELEKYCKKVRIFKRPNKPWTFKNILRTGFSKYPFLVIRNLSSEERQAVTEELEKEKYDLVHAETFYVMPHIPQIKIPIILVDQTIEFQVYQHFVESPGKSFWKTLLKPFLYLDVYKIKFWELKFWQKASRVIAVSQADKEKMLSFDNSLDVDVVPNGAGEDLMTVWQKRIPEKEPTVFFQANYDWMQNVEAAENLAKKVFPLIRKNVPNAQCWIVGQGALAKLANLSSPGLKIIDLDNSDMQGVVEVYRRATIFVAPLEGPGGTRLKILAAMAAGVPVVTTSVGIEGIDAEEGKEVLIADSWEKIAEKTILLIKDNKMYQGLANAARKLVEEKYSYQSIAKTLEKIYLEVTSGKN